MGDQLIGIGSYLTTFQPSFSWYLSTHLFLFFNYLLIFSLFSMTVPFFFLSSTAILQEISKPNLLHVFPSAAADGTPADRASLISELFLFLSIFIHSSLSFLSFTFYSLKKKIYIYIVPVFSSVLPRFHKRSQGLISPSFRRRRWDPSWSDGWVTSTSRGTRNWPRPPRVSVPTSTLTSSTRTPSELSTPSISSRWNVSRKEMFGERFATLYG